jgi:hypothetical protein
MPMTQEGPDFLSRYCPVQASGLGETVNASSNQELPLWKPRKKLPVIMSSAVSTRIRICMLPPLSMIGTAFSGANASPQRDKGTSKCSPGCDPSERSSASASRRPAPMARGFCATCSRPDIIAIGRLRTDPRTKAYTAKRIAEGHSKLETIRCLKRYIAREVFTLIKSRRCEINQARAVT